MKDADADAEIADVQMDAVADSEAEIVAAYGSYLS